MPLRVNGYELYDRTDGHVIAEGQNTFDLAELGNTYRARLGRETDIRPKAEGNERETIV